MLAVLEVLEVRTAVPSSTSSTLSTSTTFALPKIAAREYGFEFEYESRPQGKTYASLLAFGDRVRDDVRDLKPRDMIDLQSFNWVQGSDEYEE